MCYSAGAREGVLAFKLGDPRRFQGLHAWWSGSSNSSGLKIYSQALTMWMNQKVEARGLTHLNGSEASCWRRAALR